MRLHRPPKWDNPQEIMILLETDELAVITNALEDASINWEEGSDIQLKALDLIMTITKVMGN